MIQQKDKNAARKIVHDRVRKKIVGSEARPRFNVFRSLKHIYVQIIDDDTGHTLVAASTMEEAIKAQIGEMNKREQAKFVGKIAAERALAKEIKQVVFDRGGYLYTGRVAEVAAGAREAGLDF